LKQFNHTSLCQRVSISISHQISVNIDLPMDRIEHSR
jgi:hypothetical protein